MLKTHPVWKQVGKGNKKHWERIELEDCPACLRKCRGCKQPFTLSTAEDEQHYCSVRCEHRHDY